MTENKSHLLSEATKKEIDLWLKKFPADQKQSAVLTALHLVQDDNQGWITEDLMDAVADYLEMPRIAVYEVATFYSMYDLEPAGRNKIYICTNISCMLKGAYKIADHLKAKLDLNFGETTKDRKVTLKEAECLAACAGAPMMQVNKKYYENLTPERVDEILEGLK